MRVVFLMIAIGLSVAAQQSSTTTADSKRYIRDSESQWAEAVANGSRTSPLPQSSKTENEIKRIEARLANAILESDVNSLNEIYADDYMHTAADGVVTDKTRRIAEFRTGATKIEFLRRDEVIIRTYRNAAIVTDVDTAKGKFGGHAFGGRARAIRVYVKQSGGWKLVAAQSTNVR
jgi:ketosteroid isomerase-like protein